MHTNPWKSTSIRTALRGDSFIDATLIHIHNLKEAEEFLDGYGFSMSVSEDVEELELIRQEAIHLLESEILREDESIPTIVLEEKDIRQLLVNASGLGLKRAAPWSGAILRVMHTLVHCRSHLNDVYHDEIRQQIMARFEPYIKEQNGKPHIGDIPLELFEQRITKSRFSVAMKLMHKAENVAADIFDWVGFRFITEYRADVLNVLAFLRSNNIITYANLKPSRSRNTLIDLEWIDEQLEQGLSTDEIREKMQNEDYPTKEKTRSDNPFSETSYHSVQITCRQRIKIRSLSGESIYFYFPFEIQLMDLESYKETREGFASHSEYKRRQREVVRRRVLPFLYNE